MYIEDEEVKKANKRITRVFIVTLILGVLWGIFWMWQFHIGRIYPFVCAIIELIGFIVIIATSNWLYGKVGKVKRERD